nr:M12 family metallo-peptidase [Bowmanella dokdonensis]
MEGPAHFSDSSFDYQHYVQDLNELAATAPSKELELAVVADTQFNMAYAGNGLEKMLAEMNIVDGIFSEQVGVQLKIVQSHVMSDDGYLTATNASTLIQDFRNYVHSEIGNPGLTHLFTGRNLDGSTVGIAYLSAMCSSYGVGITQKYGSMTALIAAHEIGHNFGAPHDNQSGSACATTGGTFLMNPMVNGNDQFSTCSLQQMNSRIQNAYCLNELDGLAPVISSTAGNSARVGLAYAYDADERIDVSGGTGLSYRLDFGPDGMIIEADGRIVWTPTAAQEGTQVAQITVSNAFGSDSQYFEIEVASAPAPAGDVIDFSQFYLGSYGGTQDKTGPVSIEDQGKTLRMQGNRWKYIDYPYVVTANTVLEFDFSSSKEGEIHAIGMDTDGQLRQKRILQLYGTQPYGKMLSRYNGKGQSQHYVVPVGLYYQGNMKTLFFGMDHDVSNPTGESVFSNVRVYEQSSEQLSFNFNDTEILSYAGGQDKTGSVHILEDGNVLRLQGNLWKAISLYTQIDKDSVLSFDFMSDSKGELHGLGFDNDDKETADKIFTLYGTQRYGNQTYSYTTPGQYQHFEIPVGQFYTGTFNKLFFMMDHDVSNPTGVSYFKNISIR